MRQREAGARGGRAEKNLSTLQAEAIIIIISRAAERAERRASRQAPRRGTLSLFPFKTMHPHAQNNGVNILDVPCARPAGPGDASGAATDGAGAAARAKSTMRDSAAVPSALALTAPAALACALLAPPAPSSAQPLPPSAADESSSSSSPPRSPSPSPSPCSARRRAFRYRRSISSSSSSSLLSAPMGMCPKGLGMLPMDDPTTAAPQDLTTLKKREPVFLKTSELLVRQKKVVPPN